MSILTLSRTAATLKRKVLVKDASGGMTMATYAAVSGYSGVPCDIQPASGSVRDRYMQTQANVTHTIYSETDIPARAEDILVAGSRIFQFRGIEPVPPGYEGQWPLQIHVEEQLG